MRVTVVVHVQTGRIVDVVLAKRPAVEHQYTDIYLDDKFARGVSVSQQMARIAIRKEYYFVESKVRTL